MGKRRGTVEALRFATMRLRRSLNAFGAQEIGQLRKEHLPFLGGVGRRTHDLYCERKSPHREVLRPHGVAATELMAEVFVFQRVGLWCPRFSLGTGC
jgi:hypothetical protein